MGVCGVEGWVPADDGVLGAVVPLGDGSPGTGPPGPALCMLAILLRSIWACWRRCCSCCCRSFCLMFRQKGTGHLFSWQCLAW